MALTSASTTPECLGFATSGMFEDVVEAFFKRAPPRPSSTLKRLEWHVNTTFLKDQRKTYKVCGDTSSKDLDTLDK